MEIKTIRQDLVDDAKVTLIMEMLFELPLKAKEARDRLASAEVEVAHAKLATANCKEVVDNLTMEAAYEVSLEVDEKDKPLYGNDAKRKAATFAKLKNDTIYAAATLALDDFKIKQLAAEQVVVERANMVKFEVDVFESVKTQARLVAGLSTESADSRTIAHALKQITKTKSQATLQGEIR